jgi:UDP-GlcNAc3NAcA epimerase
MKKVITIVGARPQFIKAAVVSRCLKEKGLEEIIVHTGQHFDKNMSEVFFTEMDIPKPNYNLDINGLTHGAMTGQMLEAIEMVLLKEKPSMVIVYGDTNSTLAGALAAAKLHIPVAHVEAGLRSFNMEMPEEINRILTDRISNILFCPSNNPVKLLEKEGITKGVFKGGDVMYDAVLYYSSKAKEKSTILKDLDIDKEYILTTIHRQENTDNIDNLKEIIDSLNELSKSYKIIFPLHPRTKNIIAKNNIKLDFNTIDPVGYFDMLQLLENCKFVVSDSGGLQKEAYFFNKHCINVRKETEWTELVDIKQNHVTGANKENILNAINNLEYKTFTKDIYGNGKAGEFIVDKIIEYGI